MPDNTSVQDLNSWVSPDRMEFLNTFNFWLLLLPLAFLIFSAVVFFIRPLKDWFALVCSIAYLVIAGTFIYAFVVQDAVQELETEKSDYLKWFDNNYGYLNLTDEEALQIKDEPNGFLDVEAKRDYVLKSVTENSDEQVLFYLSQDTVYAYKPVPQGSKSDFLLD